MIDRPHARSRVLFAASALIHTSRHSSTTWVSSGTNPAHGVYEFRRLYVENQQGLVFSGRYAHPSGGGETRLPDY